MGKPKAETAANIAIIALCAIVGVVLIKKNFFPPQPGTPPAAVSTGDYSKLLHSAMPSGAERVLFVALSPTCRYCTESIPFYRRLLEERERAGAELPVIGLVPDTFDLEATKRKIESADIEFSAWVQADFMAARLRGTPTLVLLDSEGVVSDVWFGKLSPESENAVLRSLLDPVAPSTDRL